MDLIDWSLLLDFEMCIELVARKYLWTNCLRWRQWIQTYLKLFLHANKFDLNRQALFFKLCHLYYTLDVHASTNLVSHMSI